MQVADLAELAAGLEALRGEFERLRAAFPRNRVRLLPVDSARFLGQPLTVTASVTDALTGEPVVDAPVTFVASWGRLSGDDGFRHEEGKTITLRSGAGGIVSVVLSAETAEGLTYEQSSALEARLGDLNADAATPQDAAAAFEAMVQEYRWEANYPFRQAVDIYFRDFRRDLADAVNARDDLSAWRFVETTVIAFARKDEAGDLDTEVGSTAVLDFRFKDWLGPMLETYLKATERDSPLQDDFGQLKKKTPEASPLIEGVYQRAKAFVDKQRGLVGEFAGNRVAENAIRTFVRAGIQDLPVQDRVHVQPVLEAASGVIGLGGLSVVATVGQTQQKLRQEVAVKTDAVAGQVGVLTTRVAEKVDAAVFQAELVKKADTTRLDSALAGKLDTAVFQVELGKKVDSTRFDSVIAGKLDTAVFQAELVKKVDSTRFDSVVAGKLDKAVFQTELGKKVDSTRFDSVIAGKLDTAVFQTELAKKVDATRFDTVLATKVDSTFFQAELSKKVDNSRFDTVLLGKLDKATFQTEIGQKLDSTVFTTFQTRVDQTLTTKVNVTTFNQELAKKTDLLAFDTFRDQTNRVLNTKVDGTKFDQFFLQVDQNFGVLRQRDPILQGRLHVFRP